MTRSTMSHLASAATEIRDTWEIGPLLFFLQISNILIVFGLFAFAARSILLRGRGWEVPVWLLLAFLIPVVFPIIAMIHFRKSKFSPPAPESAAGSA